MGFLRTLRTDFAGCFCRENFTAPQGLWRDRAAQRVAGSPERRIQDFGLLSCKRPGRNQRFSAGDFRTDCCALRPQRQGRCSKPLRPLYGIQSGTVELYLVKNYYRFRRGFLAVFLGYALCFGLLSLKLPVISADEVSALSRQMGQGSLNLYDVLALKGPRILFFAAQFATEGLGYALWPDLR